MSTRQVDLAMRMTADVADVEADFDRAGAAALAMGDDVERASRTADSAASRLDSVGDSADEMGSKSSQAAGGLGDLGGALSLMPGPLGAVGAGMEAVAPAVMGVTGAMDLVNLATKSNIVINTRARVVALASAASSRVVAAATRTWAVAQRVLNLALISNPIGLVVIAVAALVAGIVIAYKRSETFRAIVQAAMRGVQTAVGWVVEKVLKLVGFVKDDLPKAWNDAKTKVSSAVSWIKDKVVAGFDAMTAPIRAVIDLVEDLIGWISKIDLPDLPGIDVPGFRTIVPGVASVPSTLPSSTSSTSSTSDVPPVIIQIDVDGSGIVDENKVAASIAGVLARYFTRLGRPVTDWTAFANAV